MTHLWPDGTPITVVSNGIGRPRRLLWQGHNHAVERIVQQWRIDVDWWETIGRVWRDYYAVTTDGGLLVVIYYCRLTG